MSAPARMRRIGWFAALALCTALYLMLHLKVHAVQSDVVRAERQIVRLEQEKLLLETEYETRANLLQLSAWNQVDFGYTAPTAGQFIEGQRQLASFGTPRGPGAPDPIRVAHAGGETPSSTSSRRACWAPSKCSRPAASSPSSASTAWRTAS